MPATYTTKDGDVLDLVCYRHYGGHRVGAVEAVLSANYHTRLNDHGPVLPRGIVITLPDLPAAPAKSLVKLWD